MYENKTKDDMFDLLFNYRDLSESSEQRNTVPSVGPFMDSVPYTAFDIHYKEGLPSFDAGLGMHNEPNIINELGLDDENIQGNADNNMISGVDIFDLFGTML